MKQILKITVIMMMTLLFSCGTTSNKTPIPELKPIPIITFSKPALNCLGRPLKKIVLDRIWNCEDRLKTINGQIKAYNFKQKNAD